MFAIEYNSSTTLSLVYIDDCVNIMGIVDLRSDRCHLMTEPVLTYTLLLYTVHYITDSSHIIYWLTTASLAGQ